MSFLKKTQNVLLLFVVSMPFIYFNNFGEPPKNGFYCNDETIGHPYKESTVPSRWSAILGLCIPLLTIILVELLILPLARQRSLTDIKSEAFNVVIGYLFGAAASYSLVTVAKFTIGRLRPHFLDVCRPNFADIDCGTDAHPIFVTDYVCQGNANLLKNGPLRNQEDLTRAMNEAHVSFMSGHSCFAFQAATFLVLYLQCRVASWHSDKLGSSFLVPTLQLICLATAFWVALTRVKDHMHHPGDVVAGSLIGAFIQVFNVAVVMHLFSPSRRTSLNATEKTPLLA